MNEAARTATGDDLVDVADLIGRGQDELETTKGGEMWRRREARPAPEADELAPLLDDPDATIVVGTIDDTIVGYAIVEVEVLRDGGRLARLDDIFVLPDARSVAVGETMMELVLTWARERDCFGIDSLALPGNRATKNFFETHGLVARAIVVHRRLDE